MRKKLDAVKNRTPNIMVPLYLFRYLFNSFIAPKPFKEFWVYDFYSFSDNCAIQCPANLNPDRYADSTVLPFIYDPTKANGGPFPLTSRNSSFKEVLA